MDLKEIPYNIIMPEDKLFKDFSYLFKGNSENELNSNIKFEVKYNDFKYFETDIKKGEHKIKVTYTAEKWTDGWNWVNEYSFRYELSPAKYWKSFGNLSIIVDAQNFNKKLTANIKHQKSLNYSGITELKFDKLPVETLRIIYKPQINKVAKVLIKIKPFGLALVVGFGLILFHFFIMKFYRQKNPKKKVSWIMFIGSIPVPILFLFHGICFSHLST